MKNSKEYSKKIQKLFRSLKRKYPKHEKAAYDEPAEALVYAITSEKITHKQAQTAAKRFNEYFVDLNDLRVSRPEEIVEMLGEDNPTTREIAARLKTALRAIFEKYNTVSLQDLRKIGKRPAKEALSQINGTSPFMVDFCMLTALDGHAIPLTEKMIELLRNEQLVHPQADHQRIEGFLSRQITAKDGYYFYTLLRQESESDRKKREKTKKRTNKKTKKRKTKKTKEND
jgi:endonuclease III